jgi:hypothetical protein
MTVQNRVFGKTDFETVKRAERAAVVEPTIPNIESDGVAIEHERAQDVVQCAGGPRSL